MANKYRHLKGNTTGLCLCGCGQPTSKAKTGDPSKGYLRGQHVFYVHGHNGVLTEKYKIDPETGCWNWQGCLDKENYGFIKLKGKMRRAHHYYYIQKYGEIPANMVMDHKCRNHQCVNPDHVEPVTYAENVRRGKSAKLSVKEVLEIKQLLQQSVTLTQIAKQYGVHITTVHGIKSGKNWKGI